MGLAVLVGSNFLVQNDLFTIMGNGFKKRNPVINTTALTLKQVKIIGLQEQRKTARIDSMAALSK